MGNKMRLGKQFELGLVRNSIFELLRIDFELVFMTDTSVSARTL